MDALLCAACLGAVGVFWLHNYVKEAVVANAPGWVVQTLFPHFVDDSSAIAGGVAFKGLKIEAPFFIDDSPPGSYDFTLIDPETDSVHVDVPSPCGGTISDAGSMGGYGNALEVTCTDKTILFFAHFKTLYLGKGDTVTTGQALGRQGSTGNSTGEHIHLEVTLPGYAMQDRSVTQPFVEDVLFPFWRAGFSNASGELTDQEIICAIGESEGTRDANCQPNQNYYGHTDPGNGASNIGTFSFQGNASTPEQADQIWLHKLRSQEFIFQQQAQQKFGRSLSKSALLAAMDLYTQSPLAAGDFVAHLSNPDPDPQAIIRARVKSYQDPATGVLEAPGLGNDPQRVWADQERRVSELLRVIQ